MGMGEPLANYEQVLKAVRIMNHPEGLSIGARHIAISTCGLPDEMRKLAEEGLQLALAVSLHGATNEVREQLVPINRRHTIAAVMAAAKVYAAKTGRKISFEYVIVPGLNDTFEQADALAQLLQDFPNMVNLIPRSSSAPGLKTDPGPAHRFAATLKRRGIEAAVRRSRGAEVLGACGQLSSQVKKKAG
jgi:23S rRNA (adenine2503-C2)-methyltransferase